MSLQTFTEAYMTAMLSSTDGPEDTPLDRDYDPSDLAPEARESIESDCKAFYEAHSEAWDGQCLSSVVLRDCTEDEYAGHDFWLTRAGHGCGFWDGDWSDKVAKPLTDAADAFGEQWPYSGDDGLVYV